MLTRLDVYQPMTALRALDAKAREPTNGEV